MTCWRATSTRWPYFMGINALSQIHPDLASTLHGLEWAIPVILVDSFVMAPKWRGQMHHARHVNSFTKTFPVLRKWKPEFTVTHPCTRYTQLFGQTQSARTQGASCEVASRTGRFRYIASRAER